MTSSNRKLDTGGHCPLCGFAYVGAPNQCTRCGTLLGEAATDARRIGQANRQLLRSRKAMSDTVFLVGLLLGGPMISFGSDLRIGVILVLAGGLCSVLRRYTDLSLAASLAVGSLASMVVAALFVSPATQTYADTMAAEEARQAFVDALVQTDGDLLAETRGAGAVVVWFQIPTTTSSQCGDFPPDEVRTHLRDLGFVRVVVAEPNQSGGLCSFAP